MFVGVLVEEVPPARGAGDSLRLLPAEVLHEGFPLPVLDLHHLPRDAHRALCHLARQAVLAEHDPGNIIPMLIP